MKTCTYCGKEYSDDTRMCAVDREPLNQADAGGLSMEDQRSTWQIFCSGRAMVQAGAWTCFLLGLLALADLVRSLSNVDWQIDGDLNQPLFVLTVLFLPFLAVVYPQVPWVKISADCEAEPWVPVFYFGVLVLESVGLCLLFGPVEEWLNYFNEWLAT